MLIVIRSTVSLSIAFLRSSSSSFICSSLNACTPFRCGVAPFFVTRLPLACDLIIRHLSYNVKRFLEKAEKNQRRDTPAAVILLCLKANLPKRPALPRTSLIQSLTQSASRSQFGLCCPAPCLRPPTVFVRLNPLAASASQRALRAIGRHKCSFAVIVVYLHAFRPLFSDYLQTVCKYSALFLILAHEWRIIVLKVRMGKLFK